jgi:hypothetical protein
MGNVSIVVALFFLIFAILGVQLFSGKFYSCNDTTVRQHTLGLGLLAGTAAPALFARCDCGGGAVVGEGCSTTLQQRLQR